MTSTYIASSYTGPILVTAVYLLTYYTLFLYALRQKGHIRRRYKARGEKFDRYFSQDRELLALDRYTGNMLEHMPPFLALLWLNAVFVGTLSATAAGTVYALTRLAYPFLVGRTLGVVIRRRVLLATFSGYGVILYFVGSLVWSAFA
jgi:hypothetical protein